MRRLALAVLVLLAACKGSATAPEWEQASGAVRLNFYYVLLSEQPIVIGDETWRQRLGAEHARVVRRVACDGILLRRDGFGIDDPCGMQQGDSNVLEAGTPLYLDAEFGGQRLHAVANGKLLTFHGLFPPD